MSGALERRDRVRSGGWTSWSPIEPGAGPCARLADLFLIGALNRKRITFEWNDGTRVQIRRAKS